jgi:molybdopterin/thiamine biosynthesis adenylyltransferase
MVNDLCQRSLEMDDFLAFPHKKLYTGPMEDALAKIIQSKTRRFKDPAGRQVDVLDEREALEIGRACHCSLGEVYRQTLRLGFCPYRYIRNRDILSLQEQLKLAESRVTVVGAGGLGGSVLSLLGRVGVGQLVVVDGDVFDETNLNRQAFCNVDNLGKPKAEEARRQMKRINPSVEVTAHSTLFSDSNGRDILTGSQVAVDALDNVESRLTLEKAALSLDIPLVHGALAGFEGQIMTIFPGDPGPRQIYGEQTEKTDAFVRPEAILGVPGIMPSLIAAFQAMEVLKILLNRGSVFRNTMAYLDLESGEMNRFYFGED